ncbi:hypothetical protein GCM10011571_34840 [Marinithermofilum abyssi]|uniref:Beta-mannosidase-like galactose-binding domain-containing protein n=2 Tax=Marinithermofilum abyssi TaxID=1571185 RepID=A0A8J2VFM8_9BACL|nr:hypothetical protein GCM10011571_34840 [Marinithermofilum abyssi]
MLQIDLDGKWKFRKTGDSDWLDGQVPGSVMSDLLRCGRIKDPFYRDNEKEALQMASYDYEYKRNLRRQRGKVRDHSKARFL